MTEDPPVLYGMALVRERLSPMCPQLEGARTASSGAPPSLRWVLLGISSEEPRATGKGPSLLSDRWRYECHVWGETLAQAAWMRAATVTALRETFSTMLRIGDTDAFSEEAFSDNGHVLVVAFTVGATLDPIDLDQLPTIAPLATRTGRAEEVHIHPLAGAGITGDL